MQDVDIAPHALAGGVGEGGLADARFAQQARIHGQVLFVHHHPRGQQLPHELVLPDPLDGDFIGMGQVQGDAFDLDGHRLPFIIGELLGRLV